MIPAGKNEREEWVLFRADLEAHGAFPEQAEAQLQLRDDFVLALRRSWLSGFMAATERSLTRDPGPVTTDASPEEHGKEPQG